jgi:3-hydroxyisobutyrate dehydrogenase
MSEIRNVGVVGIGIMGKSMALNLLNSGFQVTVWNRTREKTRALKEAGAVVAESPRELAAVCELIITIVNDTPDVEEVIFEKLAPGLSAGKILVDMSTIDPEATVDFAQKLALQKVEMLDAPVSGGDIGARNGTLTIMVGGKKEVFQKAMPVFEAIGKNIVHCGGNGDGQRVKMINQILCGLHAVALCEAFSLARETGLDPEIMHSVVSSGAAGSWALDNLGPRLLKGDTAPGFKLSMQLKDLRIANQTAQKFGHKYPGTALAFELFSKAEEKGLGDLGSHGLIELYK